MNIIIDVSCVIVVSSNMNDRFQFQYSTYLTVGTFVEVWVQGWSRGSDILGLFESLLTLLTLYSLLTMKQHVPALQLSTFPPSSTTALDVEVHHVEKDI